MNILGTCEESDLVKGQSICPDSPMQIKCPWGNRGIKTDVNSHRVQCVSIEAIITITTSAPMLTHWTGWPLKPGMGKARYGEKS